jgi:hypothetical protein
LAGVPNVMFSDELGYCEIKAAGILGFKFSDKDGCSGLVAFNSVVVFCGTKAGDCVVLELFDDGCDD